MKNQDPDLQKIINKARKLKAHAEGEEQIGNEEAAKNAAAMLQNLLVKYKLSQSHISNEEEEAEDIERQALRWNEHGFDHKRRRTAWIERLCSIVCRAHGCHFLVMSGSSTLVLIGKPSNVTIAEYVMVTLRRAVEKIATIEYDKFWFKCDKNGERQLAKGFRSSFIDGFIGRIHDRFEEELVKSQPGSDSTALVIFEDDLKAVKKWMSEQSYGKAARLEGSASYNREGRQRGAASAGSMDIKGNAVGGGGANKQIS